MKLAILDESKKQSNTMRTKNVTLTVYCVFAYWQYICAAQTSGYVIEWGSHDTFTGRARSATLVLSNTLAISAGRVQCLALKDDGTVNAWSWNRKGEITFDNIVTTGGEGGDGKTSIKIPPEIWTNGVVKIDGQVLNNVISVAEGSKFGIGLKRDGTLVTWGENYVPTGLTNVHAIAAASFASLALKNDGTVVEWVSQKWLPQYGQLIEAPFGSNVIAIAIAETSQGTRSIALKKDGTVVYWGEEAVYKDATPPSGLRNVVAVAAGFNHSLALTRDGTVTGWGFNYDGEATGMPNTNFISVSSGQVTIDSQVVSNVAAIAAGNGYSMALKRDGTIVTWGRIGNNHPATVPAGLSNVVAIAAGDNFCLAITTNRAVAERFRQN